MAVSMIGPKFFAWDRNGKPLAFGKLYTYQARTNTPKPTYQSEDQVVENTNPVILNGEGYANVYLDGSYKMVLKDDKDNEIWTSDPVTANQADEWVNCFSVSYVGPTAFKIAGNQTDSYVENRKIRVDNNTTEYSYTKVVSSTYASGETSVVVLDPVITTGVNSVCTSVVGDESSFNKNDVGGLTNYSSKSVDDMVAGITLDGTSIDHAVGQQWSSGGTRWRVKGVSSPVVIGDFEPLTRINVTDFEVIDGDISSALVEADAIGDTIVPLGLFKVTSDAQISKNCEILGLIDVSAKLEILNGYTASECPFKILDGGSVLGAENNTKFKQPSLSPGYNEKVLTPYDITSYFAAAVGVGTFTTTDIPITFENKSIIVKVEYTGIFNAVKLQTRDANNSFLGQALNNTSGSFSPLSSSVKALFTGDGVKKVTFLTFSITNDMDLIRSIRLVLNTEVADQDASFTVVSASYGYRNTKNVIRQKANINIGRNYVAIRGSVADGGVLTQQFYDDDESLEAMKREVDAYRDVFDLDGIRLPIYYKNLTNSDGTTKPDNMLRVKRMIDYINAQGFSAIVTLNHFFTTPGDFDDKIVIETDINDNTKRQSMAERAKAVTDELNYHPSILVWELENEANASHLSRYSGLSIADYFDYLNRVFKTINRSGTAGNFVFENKIPCSISFSGTKAHKYWIKKLAEACDILDIHAYGIGLAIDDEVEKPIISTECELDNEIRDQKRASATICPWWQYVRQDFSTSYDEDTVLEVRSKEGFTTSYATHPGYFTHPNNFASPQPSMKPDGAEVFAVFSSSTDAIKVF